MSVPSNAPMLKPAWNWGITVRRMRRSTAEASTLSGTLLIAKETPLRKIPAASMGTEANTTPPVSRSIAATNPVVAMCIIRRPPNRVTSGPDAATVSRDPTAPTSSTTPICASSSPRASRIEGRRDSQLDIMMPIRVKMPMRCQRARITVRATGAGGARGDEANGITELLL